MDVFSPFFYLQYLFADVINMLVTITTDFGSTFNTYTTPFAPTALYTHSDNPNIVLGMDENDVQKKVLKC